MVDLLYKDLSFAIIGAAMEVHKILGAGFFEAVYQAALVKEFEIRGIKFKQYVKLPVIYKGDTIGIYEADFLVEDKVVLEIKAIAHLNSAVDAQAFHYLAATGYKLAIILNFGAGSLEQRRIVR